MNALLDYGTSSDSDEDFKEESVETSKPKLPKPIIGETALNTSVFANPFVQAEMAKAAILEKHVKMVPGKDKVQTINGKKICWNHRKGRCKFGHNCKYAHDSDIEKSNEDLEENVKCKGVVYEAPYQSSISSNEQLDEPVLPTDDEVWDGSASKKKRRPGLSKGLVPTKKVLKMYKEQKIKDEPYNSTKK